MEKTDWPLGVDSSSSSNSEPVIDHYQWLNGRWPAHCRPIMARGPLAGLADDLSVISRDERRFLSGIGH